MSLPKTNFERLDTIEIDTSTSKPKVIESDQISDRLARARQDRILLSRFLAGFLIFVAVINTFPAVYSWYYWSENSNNGELPRWTYIQIFVAILHVVYAIFVLQIPDWSSLKAVSIALLIIAAIFGFVSAGLALGGSSGEVAVFLGMPYVMIQNAMIWCVAMLFLAVLTSYLSGREAINWQRADMIFNKIVTESTEPAELEDG